MKGDQHSAENEAVFVRQMVADQVVEAEDANFEDGVVGAEAEVHDRQDAHELKTAQHHNTVDRRICQCVSERIRTVHYQKTRQCAQCDIVACEREIFSKSLKAASVVFGLRTGSGRLFQAD